MPKGRHVGVVSGEPALDEGFAPRPSEAAPPPVASEPEWVDGEEVYAIYRPDRDADDQGGDTDHAA